MKYWLLTCRHHLTLCAGFWTLFQEHVYAWFARQGIIFHRLSVWKASHSLLLFILLCRDWETGSNFAVASLIYENILSVDYPLLPIFIPSSSVDDSVGNNDVHQKIFLERLYCRPKGWHFNLLVCIKIEISIEWKSIQSLKKEEEILQWCRKDKEIKR